MRVNRIPISKAFDLYRVAAGVAKEHRPLLSGLAFKAYLWLQDKLRIGGFEAFGQGQPVGLEQDDAEVGHGHHVLADLAGVADSKGLAQMQRNLVTKEVEVDPGVGAAAFAAAKGVAVEATGGIEVGDVVGEVKNALHGAGQRLHKPRLRG